MAPDVQQTVIERLARWIIETPPAAIAEAQLAQARLLTLDTIGCGIAGWAEELARECVAEVAERGGAAQCQIIGSRLRTNLASAVFGNGVLVRVLDLNDYIIGDAAKGGDMGGHPSDNIPVALAAGERFGCNGRDVLAAIVIGYELYGRLKGLMDRHAAWDGITASGAVAAAMAGRLIRLDHARMSHALGLALARSVTPAAVRSGQLSAAKSISNALIAETGTGAALLAARGITGPLALFEQKHGLQQVFVRAEGFERLTRQLGADAVILGAHVKAYPCLATGQSIVAAALKMHAQLGGDVGWLANARIVLADYPTIIRQQNDAARSDPRSREAADHSFPFLAAVALIDGAFGLAQFEGERWNDTSVRGVMARLTFANDPTWAVTAPDAYPCRIEATTTDGRQLTASIAYPPGFSRGSIAAGEVLAKFDAVTAPHLAAPARRAIVDAVMGLDASADLGAVVRAIGAAVEA